MPARFRPWLVAIVVLALPGCAAWSAIAPLLTAGIGTAGQIAQAVAAKRGAAITRDEFIGLDARIKALEDAEHDERESRAALADAGLGELPAALDRATVADGARGVARQEVARFVETLQASDAGAGQ